MPREWDYPVIRDGFSSAWSEFYTERGHIQRIHNQTLRSMFLPNVTKAGQVALLEEPDSVRGQFQQYGIAIDESQFSGNGFILVQEVLRAGGCDKVPPHILNLKAELIREWQDAETERHHDTKRPRDFNSNPEWTIYKHFLNDRRQPDRTITTTVVAVLLSSYPDSHADILAKFAEKADGLFYQVGKGLSAQKFFVGWDEAAVAEAAENYMATEKKEKRDAERQRRQKRLQLLAAYRHQAQKLPPSPVGR